jgi:hypothetical protein
MPQVSYGSCHGGRAGHGILSRAHRNPAPYPLAAHGTAVARRSRMRHCVGFIFALSACGTSANTTLGELPMPRLSLQLWHGDDAGPTPGFASISYDVDTFRNAHDGACAVVDLDASLTGADIETTWHGGDDDFDGCSYPGFEFDVSHLGERTVTLRAVDGSFAIEATFSAEQLAPHLPTLRSPGEWRFGGGDTVVLGWSHPQDLITGADFLPNPVYFHTGTITDPNYFDIEAQLAGDEIRFAIPDPPPIVGAGFIVTRFGYVDGTAITCKGATACTFSREAGYAHTVVIDP